MKMRTKHMIAALSIATAMAACGESEVITEPYPGDRPSETVQALNTHTGEIRALNKSELTDAWLPCPEDGSCFDVELSCDQVGPKLCYRLRDCEIAPVGDIIRHQDTQTSTDEQDVNTDPRTGATQDPDPFGGKGKPLVDHFNWYVDQVAFTCVSVDEYNIPDPVIPPVVCDDGKYHPGDEILYQQTNTSTKESVWNDSDAAPDEEEPAWTNGASPEYYEDIAPVEPCDGGFPEYDDCGNVVGCYVPGNPGIPVKPDPKPPIVIPPVDLPDFKCDDIKPLSGAELNDRCTEISQRYSAAIQSAKQCDPRLKIRHCLHSVRPGFGICMGKFDTTIVNSKPPVLDKTHEDSLERQWECLQCDNFPLRGITYPEIDCATIIRQDRAEDFTCREPDEGELPGGTTSGAKKAAPADEYIIAPPTGMCLSKFRTTNISIEN